MAMLPRLGALVASLFAALVVRAADPQPINRVMSILDIETSDPAAYAAQITKYNEIAKTKLNVDPYLRVFESQFDGRTSGTHVRVSVSASSVAELMKNMATMEADPAIKQWVESMKPQRKLGARVLYRAVRFDGASTKGAWTYSTLANIPDEAAYLKAIESLRVLFDNVGLKDAKISVYRAIAGRADHSHRVVISTPSSERLAAFLDLASSDSQLVRWQADAAKLRTVVANITSREITK